MTDSQAATPLFTLQLPPDHRKETKCQQHIPPSYSPVKKTDRQGHSVTLNGLTVEWSKFLKTLGIIIESQKKEQKSRKTWSHSKAWHQRTDPTDCNVKVQQFVLPWRKKCMHL